jgi:hypothetical protein
MHDPQLFINKTVAVKSKFGIALPRTSIAGCAAFQSNDTCLDTVQFSRGIAYFSNPQHFQNLRA